MHDPRSQLPSDARQRTEVMQQCIHQRAPIARVVGRSRAGVHHHARRLVDYRQIAVFVDNIERDLLRNGAQWRRLGRPGDGDPLAAAQPQRRFGGRVIDQHFPLLDQLLNARARDFRQLRRQVLVKPLARVVRGNSKSEGKVEH